MSEAQSKNQLLAEIIRSRRTINQFTEVLPPLEVLLESLELACWAPNHKLTEPWRYYILGRETSQKLVELNAEMVSQEKGPEAAEKKRKKWSAIPGWLVITSKCSDDLLREKENYAAVCCAIQNLSLSLWASGIGMKWTTGPVTRSDGIYEILNLARQEEEIVGVMWYGYPAETPTMKRHPVTDFIKQLP